MLHIDSHKNMNKNLILAVQWLERLTIRNLRGILSRAYLLNAKKLGQRLNLMCGTRAAIHDDFYARTRCYEWST